MTTKKLTVSQTHVIHSVMALIHKGQYQKVLILVNPPGPIAAKNRRPWTWGNQNYMFEQITEAVFNYCGVGDMMELKIDKTLQTISCMSSKIVMRDMTQLRTIKGQFWDMIVPIGLDKDAFDWLVPLIERSLRRGPNPFAFWPVEKKKKNANRKCI